ncbi:MAG TPA: threo-3-hydroxy-L-aspartate ammonia-lyase [Gammaproteobacteria bacterium]|nr:threo-3-hydroxy-L-aspartate ammonia-lyase [Gammaproteobacteria bacterium]|tara:strand:+ start:676 stop:1635 length:960 start_codon:yes stop_codon:yes gene_type:complete
MSLPTYEHVLSAAQRLEGVAHKTPTLVGTPIDQKVGAEVIFKCENLQRINAFKFRGAWNAISQLSENDRRTGVITHSSGNHAQAVALAGNLLGIETTIVMPENAPATKLAGTKRYATRVVTYDPAETKREVLCQNLISEKGYLLIPPFDHPHIIAGQGTAAMELLQQSGPLDLLLVPCGGGGLLSGTALSAHALAPGCKVIGVEPENADDAVRSFRNGRIERIENPQTIADGTRTESLGELTFEIIRQRVHDMVSVSEQAIIEATRVLFEDARIVVEPSGALGLAALLSGVIKTQGRAGIIISGGNIDSSLMQTILNNR